MRTFLAKECGEALAGTRYKNLSVSFPKIAVFFMESLTSVSSSQATASGAATSDEGAVR